LKARGGAAVGSQAKTRRTCDRRDKFGASSVVLLAEAEGRQDENTLTSFGYFKFTRTMSRTNSALPIFRCKLLLHRRDIAAHFGIVGQSEAAVVDVFVVLLCTSLLEVGVATTSDAEIAFFGSKAMTVHDPKLTLRECPLLLLLRLLLLELPLILRTKLLSERLPTCPSFEPRTSLSNCRACLAGGPCDDRSRIF